MGFFNRLFGGPSASPEASAGNSVSYPDRFAMAPESSPLLKHGGPLVSAVLDGMGIGGDACECLAAASRTVSASAGSDDLWKRLSAAASERAGGLDSRAQSLARALWILCTPLEDFPAPRKDDGAAREVLRRLAVLAAEAGLDSNHSDLDTRLYFTGEHGLASYGVSVDGYSAPDGSEYVGIESNTTSGISAPW